MTVLDGSIDAGPLSWPLSAIAAAVIFGAMIVLLAIIPNLLAGSDPSQTMKIVTIVYVVAVFAVTAALVAVWQNRIPASTKQDSHRVSAFGRPMREGPGFASFKTRTSLPGRSQPDPAVDLQSVAGSSSFGRPMKKGDRR